MSPPPARKTFATSRLSEFVTEAELTKQIEARISAYLAELPTERWDVAVRKIAEEEVSSP
jgi:hypothetical protein